MHAEQALAVGGVKAVPAVRAMARKLGVDLSRVAATGTDGAVTMADVKQAAANGSAKLGAAPAPVAAAAYAAPVPAQVSAPVQSEARTPLFAAGKPMRTQPPGVVAKGQPEPLKGVRRNMARVMADAHSKVVPTTLNDDADIHAWLPGNDVTARLVRAIVVAAQKVPAMNAWFDGEALTRTLHAQVDIGIAVDTDDGLFVPALRNADMLDARGIREGVNRLREQVESRSIAASELVATPSRCPTSACSPVVTQQPGRRAAVRGHRRCWPCPPPDDPGDGRRGSAQGDPAVGHLTTAQPPAVKPPASCAR